MSIFRLKEEFCRGSLVIYRTLLVSRCSEPGVNYVRVAIVRSVHFVLEVFSPYLGEIMYMSLALFVSFEKLCRRTFHLTDLDGKKLVNLQKVLSGTFS